MKLFNFYDVINIVNRLTQKLINQVYTKLHCKFLYYLLTLPLNLQVPAWS